MSTYRLTRRAMVAAGAALAGGQVFKPWIARAAATEIIHWSWLAASTAKSGQKMIERLQDARETRTSRSRMEVVPEEQYPTKILGAAATGKAPDSAGGRPARGPRWRRTG